MISRRTFFERALTAAAVGAIWPALSTPIGGTFASLPAGQRRALLAALAAEDVYFDASAGLLRKLLAWPEEHPSIASGNVHPLPDSAVYASALLDSGEPERMARAQEILRHLLPLQDRDAGSRTAGLWPAYVEEPLAATATVDADVADLCAVPLLSIWLHHRDELDKEIADTVREAVEEAARAIARRDVAPSYTNIAVMGTYVVLAAAQEFKLPDLRAYAKGRLQKLHRHILGQGSFAEYSSPIYTTVMLNELTRMLLVIRDARDLTLIQALHDLAWKHAATHFHPPTGQWAGPHSRSYETDLRRRPEIVAFIERALPPTTAAASGEAAPLGLSGYAAQPRCPTKWTRLWRELPAPRQVVEVFTPADAGTPGAHQAVIGTTWLHPRFTLGSVNRGDLARERRPLLAYWGTPQECTSLRLRFLKDEVDFGSALFFSVQHHGHLVGAVTFRRDALAPEAAAGPPTVGAIRGRDFRVRFELGGELKPAVIRRLPETKGVLVIEDDRCRFLLRILGDGWGGHAFTWDLPEMAVGHAIDGVAYSGDEIAWEPGASEDAYVCFALQEWPRGLRSPIPPAPEFLHWEHAIDVRLKADGRILTLQAPTRPGAAAALNDALVSRVA